jgi:hypothetical protein
VANDLRKVSDVWQGSNQDNRTEPSEQVEWYGQHLSKENWKDVLTASLKRQQVIPGLDGGFVVCGTSTSRMTIAEMTELIELAMAFGAEKGVVFSECA